MAPNTSIDTRTRVRTPSRPRRKAKPPTVTHAEPVRRPAGGSRTPRPASACELKLTRTAFHDARRVPPRPPRYRPLRARFAHHHSGRLPAPARDDTSTRALRSRRRPTDRVQVLEVPASRRRPGAALTALSQARRVIPWSQDSMSSAHRRPEPVSPGRAPAPAAGVDGAVMWTAIRDSGHSHAATVR